MKTTKKTINKTDTIKKQNTESSEKVLNKNDKIKSSSKKMKTLTRSELEKLTTDNFIEAEIKKDMLEKNLKYVVTRFPPEPNGFLHIGHTKALITNFGIAEKFGGYTNLRFDDTNPAKEDIKYAEGIIEDIKWLGLKWKNLYYASDYYEKMYDYAIKLIKKGLAYVDDLSPEELNEYRGTFNTIGKNSPYRDRTVEENLQLFADMRAGKFKDGECCLRAKIDMASANMNMRDPALYRILHTDHYRQGNKWCIYPMYDFAQSIEDAIEGITHSLCSNEYEDHRPLYNWVIENCDFHNTPNPRQIEFCRTNVVGYVMSKRYLKKLVDTGKCTGWDDPRFPTLRGMRARGYTPSSLHNFVSRIGIAGSIVDRSLLEYCVREELNKIAVRAMAVFEPIKVVITNYKGEEELDIENNPNDENAGTHKVKFGSEIYIEADDFMEDAPSKYFRLKPEGEVRLKGAYIIKCNKVVKDKNGKIEHLECTYYPESKSGSDNSGIKVKGTIHWVNAKDCLDIAVNKYGSLVKEGLSFDGNNLDEVFNENSWEKTTAKAEKYLLSCPLESRFQFIRKGYYYLIKKEGDKLTFNETVSLKDNFKI